MSIPIKKWLDKVPGGIIIVPLFLGCIINTLFPAALQIGSFTTGIVNGTSALVGLFFICMGAQLDLKCAPHEKRRNKLVRKKDVEKISDVVSAILRMQGLETPLNEARAVNAWSEVVGERVANATGNVRIYNQVLFVEVPSPALRNNLFMQRKQLVKKINALVKSDVVTDIMFK